MTKKAQFSVLKLQKKKKNRAVHPKAEASDEEGTDILFKTINCIEM